MEFQKPVFFAFFIILCGLLAVCPKRFRLDCVTAASLFFYGWWYPPYLILLLSMVAGCWLLLQAVWRDKRWLPFAVILSLIPLCLFKYTDFVLSTIAALGGIAVPHLGWALPLAISFVTFTMISYLVDTARAPGKTPPRFWPTAVYLTFFPHLISGPILRAGHILPQLPRLRFDRAAFVPNLALFTAGIVKKVLIADPVGAFVDQAYAAHATLSGWEGVAAIFGFAIQIYCDFSAYSDMAIALAGMLGISFPENFHSPYTSASFSEIWRRWHMTLSFWLRDYLFKPLHSRFYKHSRQLSIIITMMVSGLWHGAAWTFVLWGLIQGMIMAVENATGYARFANKARSWQRALCVMWTFLIWSLLGAIFRAPNLSVAYDVAIGTFIRGGWNHWPQAATMPMLVSLALLLLHPVDQMAKIRAAATKLPSGLLVPLLLAIIFSCSVASMHISKTFYYFAF